MVDRKFSTERIPGLAAAQIPTVQYSSGNARALQEFSRNLYSMSNQYEDQLDQQADAEATNAGAIAGSTGDFELQNYGTIRGRAFNKAAVETYASTLDTQAIIRLNEIQTKYWNDPAGMAKAQQDYISGVSEELKKTSPEQAIAFKNRNLVRAQPGVEQARDNVFKLTRDEADAALITNETATRALAKSASADLFSTNPERSRAAAKSLEQVQNDYLKIFDAIDPGTGKPLYAADERAKARAQFRDLVQTEASNAWFNAQPNKSEAYLKMMSGDFKIRLNASNDQVQIHMVNQGATRNDPLKPELQNQLKAAAAATGDYSISVQSGGQETAEEVAAGIGARTGSVRHDHGGAGDMRLVANGKVLDMATDREAYLKFAENLAAAGVTGIGIDEAKGYIHAGGGSQASWGYRGKSNSHAFLPSDFDAAIEAGRKRHAEDPIDTEPSTVEVPLKDTMSETAWSSLDADMRAQITFSNQQTDRQREEAARVQKETQNQVSFDYTSRALMRGKVDPQTKQLITPPSGDEIRTAVRNGLITGDDGAAIIRTLNTARPAVSDETTLRDIQTRIYAGEDTYSLIVNAGSKLTSDDAASLLATNNSVVRNQNGEFNADQKYYLSTLKTRLGADNLFSGNKMFSAAEQNRVAQALDEYRTRVLDPNNPLSASEVSNDIATRATNEAAGAADGRLSSMVMPRFSVPVTGQYRIDILASKKALIAASNAGKLSPAELKFQALRLKEWDDAQQEADRLRKGK